MTAKAARTKAAKTAKTGKPAKTTKAKPRASPRKGKAKKTGMAATKSRPPLKPNKDGVVLLSGGNPQIPKGEGDGPVQAYIAAVPGWKRDVAKRLDTLIARNVPGVRKAVKWNSPFYGIQGQGWFASFHVFTNYVKLTFFRGTSLRPVPSGGTSAEGRWIDIHEGDLDEEQLATWIRQAAAIPGWLA